MLIDIFIPHINKNDNIIWNFKPPISRFQAKFIDIHHEK
jgi:hypothetical protein